MFSTCRCCYYLLALIATALVIIHVSLFDFSLADHFLKCMANTSLAAFPCSFRGRDKNPVRLRYRKRWWINQPKWECTRREEKRNAEKFYFFTLVFKSSDKFTYPMIICVFDRRRLIKWIHFVYCITNSSRFIGKYFFGEFKMKKGEIKHDEITVKNVFRCVFGDEDQTGNFTHFFVVEFIENRFYFFRFFISFSFLNLGLTRTSFVAGSAINVTWHLAYAHRVSTNENIYHSTDP